MKTKRDIYCTSFCNRGHDMRDGKPIAHECYVLNVEALRMERDQGANAVLEARIPLHNGETHAGKR